jgi:hypothetical protein
MNTYTSFSKVHITYVLVINLLVSELGRCPRAQLNNVCGNPKTVLTTSKIYSMLD